MKRRSFLQLAATAAALPLAPRIARAQAYPAKPITIIVPASPGGVTDMLARILAQHFNADWGAQTVVENKPGANNQVAAEYVMHQPGDGYTLFIGPETTFIVNPTLYPNLRYKLADFTPITGLAQINHGLILHPSVPANNVKELVALAKAKPGQLNYGTYGAGSSGHLNMEMFKAVTGTDLVAVHYKGAAPAMQDVIAGHIQLMFVSVGNAVPQSKSGAVKFIALGAPKRMALLPDVPTVAEFRLSRLHGGVVVRAVRLGRHSARRGRQDQRRGAQDLRRSGRSEDVSRRAIFRIHCRHAAGTERAHSHRRAAMAQADRDRAYHGRVGRGCIHARRVH